MIRFFLMTLMMAVVLSTTGFAADNTKTSSDPTLPKPLQDLRDQGIKMRYLGRDLGYDAWIAVQDGQEQYFYVTPDQSAFFLGVLFNKNGRAITLDQLQRLKGKNDPIFTDLVNAPSQKSDPVKAAAAGALTPPAKDVNGKPASSEQLYADVMAAHSFILGKQDAPEISMFIDPLCAHCKDMLQDLKKDYIDAGKIRVRVIPVGAVAPESRGYAADLLAARDAGDRLFRFMGGDIDALNPVGKASAAPIDENVNVLLKWKFAATPITVYRAKDGKVKLIQGRAKDLAAVLKDLS
jgi:hypothetical protein